MVKPWSFMAMRTSGEPELTDREIRTGPLLLDSNHELAVVAELHGSFAKSRSVCLSQRQCLVNRDPVDWKSSMVD